MSYSKSVVSFVLKAAESCAVASEHIKMPPSARRVCSPASLRLIIPLRRRLGLSTLGEEEAMFQGWQGFSGRRPDRLKPRRDFPQYGSGPSPAEI